MGNALADAGINIFPHYGSTEIGPVTPLFRYGIEKKLWDWLQFTPNVKTRWADQGDGTYECQILVRLALYTFSQCELFFADNSDVPSVSRESPGRQGLYYFRFIYQASDD